MADSAIEKLFEEIRQAKATVIAVEEEIKELEVARRKARERENEARARVALLDETLRKHIHEGMPIVQAKMIAHEEQLESDRQDSLIIGGAITASKITVGSITAAKLSI